MPGANPVVIVPEQFSVEALFDGEFPLTIGELPEDQDLVEASVEVVEAFNGSAPTLKLGTAADDDLLLVPADTELGVAGVKFTKTVSLPGPEDLLLTIDKDDSTAGKVLVIVRAVLREEP
jgi:hypothetical protein